MITFGTYQMLEDNQKHHLKKKKLTSGTTLLMEHDDDVSTSSFITSVEFSSIRTSFSILATSLFSCQVINKRQFCY
jgi:hypothetical protein